MLFQNECGNPRFPVGSNSKSATVDNMIILAGTLRKEILWTLKVVPNHFSLQSCLDLNELFQPFQLFQMTCFKMFLDSKMAKSFHLSKTQCGYIINCGLASYFKELLTKAARGSPLSVLSFDESLNNTLQEKQMDLQVWHWDNNGKNFCMINLNSYFLKCSNVKNLLDVLLVIKISHTRASSLTINGRSFYQLESLRASS